MTTYYFDFDNTLVKTRHLIGYMGRKEGREFIVNNPSRVNTQIVNPALVGIVKNLGDNAIILTNSPENYARALLEKHGFPKNLRVMGSAEKPCSDQKKYNPIYLPEDSIVIGDSPIDILLAHKQRVPSIAYLEGTVFPESSLDKALPSATAKTASDLENLFSEKLIYEPRDFSDFQPLSRFTSEDITIAHIGDYYKTSSPNFNNSVFSKNILNYKNAKDYKDREIDGGQQELFYSTYYQKPRGGVSFLKLFGDFEKLLNDKIDSFNLQGKTVMFGIPNSLPEFAYLSDTNHRIAKKYNQEDTECRGIYRITPVPDAHSTGQRDSRKHIGTMAANIHQPIDSRIDNIILFDDITTTGTQFYCAAALLRQVGYKNNIIGLALGRTVHE
jgi:hypothetical protein